MGVWGRPGWWWWCVSIECAVVLLGIIPLILFPPPPLPLLPAELITSFYLLFVEWMCVSNRMWWKHHTFSGTAVTTVVALSKLSSPLYSISHYKYKGVSRAALRECYLEREEELTESGLAGSVDSTYTLIYFAVVVCLFFFLLWLSLQQTSETHRHRGVSRD